MPSQIELIDLIAKRAPHLEADAALIKRLPPQDLPGGFNEFAYSALRDPKVTLNSLERVAIMDALRRNRHLPTETKRWMLHVKVTGQMLRAVDQRAKGKGTNLSDYVRNLITADLEAAMLAQKEPT